MAKFEYMYVSIDLYKKTISTIHYEDSYEDVYLKNIPLLAYINEIGSSGWEYCSLLAPELMLFKRQRGGFPVITGS